MILPALTALLFAPWVKQFWAEMSFEVFSEILFLWRNYMENCFVCQCI